MGQPMRSGQQAPEPLRPSTNMAGSVAVTILCCFPFGLVAIYYGFLVMRRWKAGDVEGAKHASEMGEKWMYAAIGMAVILVLLTLAWRFVARRF